MCIDLVKDGRFLFKGCQRPKGECYRRSGQHEARTTGREDNGKRGQGRERRRGGADSRRSGQQEGQREEWSATRADNKKGSIYI